MSSIHIVVVGEGADFDGHRALGAFYNPTAIRATSVADMVERILAALEDAGDGARMCTLRKIASLDIVDHGNATGQRVGSDRMTATSENVSLLARLRPHMATDALVILRGCRVGAAEDLLRRVSRVLGGVRVRAGTAVQRHFPFVGIEGREVECRDNTCTSTGRGFWDWVDGT
jgi:hypothetical protein